MSRIHLVIYAVGDILPGDTPLCYGHGVGSRIKENSPEYPFAQIRKIFWDSDILLGNLEAPISPTSEIKGIWKDFFRADPSIVQALKEVNFTAVSIANNHIRDHGEKAYNSTIDLLTRDGIQPIGHRKEGIIIPLKGSIIGLLAYSLIVEPSDESTHKPPSIEQIVDNIHNLKNRTDLVIVYIHWGTEYVPYPSVEQVNMARAMIDAGADILLGSHPHILQGYEIYKSKPIFYSLGNFVADGFIKETRRSCIVRIEILDKDSLFNIRIIPVTIDPNEFRPVISDEIEKSEVISHFQKVHNCLENKTSDEYSARIGPYIYLKKKYSERAMTHLKQYFLKNLYRYPPRLILELIGRFIRKLANRVKMPFVQV